MSAFSRLTRVQRIALILAVTVLANWWISSATGYSLLGSDLFTILLVVFVVLVILQPARMLTARVLWRVRNRLLVTYFLVGMLPVLLVVLIATILFYITAGSIVAYMAQSELTRHMDEVQEQARRLADDLVQGRRRPVPGEFTVLAAVEIGNRALSSPGAIKAIPAWSQPGFKGIVRTNASRYYIAAHAGSSSVEQRVEVFAYEPFENNVVAQLIPGLGRVRIYRVPGFYGHEGEDIDFDVTTPALDSAPGRPLALGGIGGFLLRDLRALETGEQDPHWVSVMTTPGLIVNHAATSTLGSMKSGALIVLATVIGSLLFIELLAVISSIKLTRTLTRTVHDLYQGTRQVEAGDFSHRIPLRTGDQLSALATSFNSMTARVQDLIEEVKEKEKLEAELEIARQVQAQLFPKNVPKLPRLELAGLCHPARVVSGDYYDFIPLDSGATALAIGDVSGKGISAALVMAGVQSSLHAQLSTAAAGGLSTATIVARLNRQLFESTPPEKYATFYCALYDDQNGTLVYTNAGHLAPILIRGDKIVRLEPNGTVVGLFPDFPYEQASIQLESGDLLGAFTDGITECESSSGEQFGEERLAGLLLRHRDRPLDEILRTVIDAVADWAGGVDNQDDTTIFLARRF